MAVVDIRERRGRSGSVLGPLESKNSQRTWVITVDDPTDDQFTIYASPDVVAALPGLFQAHPRNLFYTCRGVRIEETDSRLHWLAIAEYSCAPISKEERERSDTPNPASRPLRLEVDSVEFERYATKDRNGNPLRNSAGDAYPAQVVEDSRTVLQLEKDVADWSTAWLLLNNTLNSGAVAISDGLKTYNIPAESGYIKRIRVSLRREDNGYPYYVISGEVHLKEDDEAWRSHLLDEGFHYLDGDTKKRIMLEDDDGEKTVEPAETQLLDGIGGILAKDDDPVYNDFDMIRVASWSTLPFFS